MTSIVLFSGGLDSTTLLNSVASSGEPVIALTLRYGSQHQQAETAAASRVITRLRRYYDIVHEVIDIPPAIFVGGGSTLMGEGVIPNEEYHDPEKESPSSTVVPFRNAVFLSVAVARAQALGASKVHLAVHQSDHEGWAYPDCSPEFIGAMMAAAYVGTLREVRLEAKFVWMTKAQIVKQAFLQSAPLGLSWSCYRGGEVHCGTCPTCRERIKAFREAGFIDPVKYLSNPTWPEGAIQWLA